MDHVPTPLIPNLSRILGFIRIMFDAFKVAKTARGRSLRLHLQNGFHACSPNLAADINNLGENTKKDRGSGVFTPCSEGEFELTRKSHSSLSQSFSNVLYSPPLTSAKKATIKRHCKVPVVAGGTYRHLRL